MEKWYFDVWKMLWGIHLGLHVQFKHITAIFR